MINRCIHGHCKNHHYCQSKCCMKLWFVSPGLRILPTKTWTRKKNITKECQYMSIHVLYVLTHRMAYLFNADMLRNWWTTKLWISFHSHINISHPFWSPVNAKGYSIWDPQWGVDWGQKNKNVWGAFAKKSKMIGGVVKIWRRGGCKKYDGGGGDISVFPYK